MCRYLLDMLGIAIWMIFPALSEARLFPFDSPANQWTSFMAEGFESPVCGVIYTDTSNLWAGIPIGGLGTGSITIENDGSLGYCTIFSHVWGHDAGSDGSPAWRDITWASGPNGLVEQYVNDQSRGKNGKPFLSLTMEGKTWALSTRKIPGVFSAERIEYWGHYPIVCLEYETSSPVTIGLEAWYPFVPGDKEASSVPAAVFEVRVRNPSTTQRCGTITIGFPGPCEREISGNSCFRKAIQSRSSGYYGTCVEFGKEISYALVSSNTNVVSSNTTLDSPEYPCKVYPYQQPPYHLDAKATEKGISLSVPFTLEPGKERSIHFFLAWYTRKWDSDFPYDGKPDRSYINHYTERFSNIGEVTEYIVQNHRSLKKRITNWQSVIYGDTTLPDWLREGLINSLHLMTKCAFWASGKTPGLEWSTPEGVFSLVESTVADGQQSCIPCDWYGNLPLVFFFPDLARSTLQAYQHLCRGDGAVPFTLGRGLDLLNDQQWDRQRTLNGCCFIDLVDRLWRTTGDITVLKEYYPSVKGAVLYMHGLISGPAGDISTAGDQWYESMAWPGMSSHVGGVRLATYQIAARMAESMEDIYFSEQCQKWIEQASEQLEKYLWAGTHYRIFNDKNVSAEQDRIQTSQDGAGFIANVNEGSGTSLDLILSHQLDGEWIADLHGVPGVFQKDRIERTLDTIERINRPLTTAGLLVVADPAGIATNYGGRMGGLSTMPASTFITAMNYLYEGKTAEGLEITRNCLNEMVCVQGMTWDMPNILIGTKEHKSRVYGTDYYQCLSLWGIPAALYGQNLEEIVTEGSLVERIIAAGRDKY